MFPFLLLWLLCKTRSNKTSLRGLISWYPKSRDPCWPTLDKSHQQEVIFNCFKPLSFGGCRLLQKSLASVRKSPISPLMDKARSLTARCYFQLDISHQNPDFRLLLTNRNSDVFVSRCPLHGEWVHILQVPAALLLSVTMPEHFLSLRGMTLLCVQDPPSVLAVLYQNRISFPITNFSHTSGSTESASIISIVKWLRKQILRLGCMGPNSSQPPV